MGYNCGVELKSKILVTHFSLSPRSWTVILRFTAKKQIPINYGDPAT